ncbi:MAG: hypothetical protein WA324_29115 [Bryobacteraceae bacterium]
MDREAFTKLVLLIVAAIVLVKCSKRYGIKDTVQWAALLVLSLFPLSLAGGLLARPVKFLWTTASAQTRIVMIGVPLVAFIATIKQKGIGTALAYALQIAVFVAFLCMCGFGLLALVVGSGNGGQ